MSLFATSYVNESDEFNIRSMRAGDAAAMLTFLAAAVVTALANNEEVIVDLNLAGAGAGPDWECWFVTAEAGNIGPLTESCPLNVARFACAVAGNPVEARELLQAQLAVASPVPTTIFKVEIAGAGIGPHYMAVCLYSVAA